MFSSPSQFDETQPSDDSITNISQTTYSIRSRNTIKAYKQRKQRYLDFCTKISHPSGSLVTEDKMSFPLETYKKPNAGSPGTMAVMDLYGDQRSTMLGVTLQDPRGPRLKAFLREIRRQDARQSRQARQARQARAQQKQQQQQQQFENENEIDVYNLKRVLTHLLQKMDGIVESMNINNNTQVAQPQPRLQPHQECYCQSEDIKSIKKSLEQINTTFDHLRRACAMFAYGMNPPPLNSCTTGAAPTPDPAMNNTGAQQNTTFDSLLTHPSYKPTPHTQSIQPMPTERTARNVRPTPLTQLKKSASPVPIHPIPFDVLSHNISHYTMQRWINNVKDLWCEYSTGIKMGGLQYPSIQEIEKKYKSGWRSETERKFFLRRSGIINAIKRISQENC